MYHVWVYYNQQFYTLERKISNAEPFFCLSLKDLLKYWKVKKKSKNKDFNDGLIYVLPFFFCIKEKGSVSYEEADFAKRKSWEVAIFQQKLQYDMTGSFKIRGNRSERFYAKFNVYIYRAIKKPKERHLIWK